MRSEAQAPHRCVMLRGIGCKAPPPTLGYPQCTAAL
jgi:hypothetical protein